MFNIGVDDNNIDEINNQFQFKSNTERKISDQLFNVMEFRSFLLHLFAISILYTHFKNADSWVEGLIRYYLNK